MSTINKIKTAISLLGISAAMASCEKYLEIPAPINLILKEQLYNDSATISSGMSGLYSSSFQNTDIGAYLYMATGLSSDEMALTTLTGQWVPFATNTYLPTEYKFTSYWATRYAVIYQANSILENLPGSKVISDRLKKQYMAEARFMRAFEYMNLTAYFGDVPLVLSTDITVTARQPRALKSLVYDTIIADLKIAERDLATSSDFTRATPWAAQALLAKAYFNKKDWTNAGTMATKAMTGPFRLETNPDNVFTSTSRESLLQVSGITGANYEKYTRCGALLSPSTNARAVPVYNLTPTQMSVFEPGDLRRDSWILRKTVNGVTYNCPYKYRLRMPSPTRVEEQILLRLPEQMLIKAEAMAEQNNLAEARKYIDTIRLRANLTRLPATLTQQQVLDAIEKERRAELFLEGDRWFYLAHKGKTDAVLQALKASYEPFTKIYPIPRNEIIYNNTLIQNDGYK